MSVIPSFKFHPGLREIRLEHVVADELKQADTARKGQRWGEQSVDSDAERRRILESKLAEAATLKRLTDVRRQVGRMTMASPDHRGLRRTKPRKMADGIGDVLRRYVAEHAAQENQVRRDGALIRICHRGIGSDDFNLSKPRLLGGAAGEKRVVLVKLNQASRDIRASRMPGKDTDQVVSLSGAHADRPHGAGGAPVERGAHLRLHDRETLAQR